MRIGGLDIATCTGWSVIDGDKVASGKWPLAGEDHGDKALELEDKIRPWVLVNRIDFVAIEAPLVQVARFKRVQRADDFASEPEAQANNPKTAMFLYGLNMCARAALRRLNVPFETVAIATHRANFLGKGKIPAGQGKKLTLERCKLLKWDVKSLDAADAVSVAVWGAGRCKHQMIMGADLFGGR